MRHLTPPRALALVAIVVTMAAACGTLDTADSVHDLRILGMRADPPEQLLGQPVSHAGDGGFGLSDGGLRPGDGGSMGGFPPDAGFGPVDGGHRMFSFDGGLSQMEICQLISEYDAGGLLPPGFDAGCSATIPLIPYTVTALVADPNGHGRTLHYVWTTCLLIDADGRCGSDTEDVSTLSQGDFVPTGISSELSTSFSPDPRLLAAAAGTGLASFDLPVQLAVSVDAVSDAGADTEIGVKQVVVTPYLAYEPVVPNRNPVFSGLQAGGIEWSPTNPPIFTSAEAGSSTTGGGGLRVGGGGTPSGVPVEAEMDAGAEYYLRYAANGTPTEVLERLQFAFYTTMGDFSPITAGRNGNITIPDAGFGTVCTIDPLTGLCTSITYFDGGVAEDAGPTDAGTDAGPQDQSYWTAASGQPAESVTFWVVVRDQRGGENWIERTAQFAP